MTGFSLRPGIASTGVSSTAYTPHSASPNAKIRTMKRLRMQYSMTFSILFASALVKPCNDVTRFSLQKFTLHLVAGLDAVQDLCVFHVEFHLHCLHQAGNILMVERDRRLLWINAHDLAFDLVASGRGVTVLACRFPGAARHNKRGKNCREEPKLAALHHGLNSFRHR